MQELPAREYPCDLPGVRILRLDPLDTGEADRWWRAYWALEDAQARRVAGDLGNTSDPATERGRHRVRRADIRFLLALRDGVPAGHAYFSRNLLDSPEVVYAEVTVDPAHRGLGIGGALAQVALEEAAEAGVRELVTEVVTGPPGDAVAQPGVGFARSAGLTEYQRVRCSVLTLPLSPDFLAAAADSTGRPPAGYRIEVCEGTPPVAWHEGLAHLRRRFSTDVPAGERQATEERWDAARVADMYERREALGWTCVLAVAVHELTGDLVGFTESTAEASMPHIVHQGDTLVLREHRGHGLGRALKLAAIAAAAPLCPEARAHRTSNAVENTAMLRVNAELGYVPAFDMVAMRRDL